ncbi:MAG: hypothetical protein M1814_000850 [Vezdaea aestivalis]|nr:MAG: hypothetical protein M1814_000850 [Vezdaea aestivalis]
MPTERQPSTKPLGVILPAQPELAGNVSRVDVSGPRSHHGFVAGVFSGIAKLSVGHPFDTIKVRLQTSPATQFRGPVDCLLQTIRNEGPLAVYKGATPPLLGWMVMDSVMLGSLTQYRALLHKHLYPTSPTLPTRGHSLAGLLSGITVSFIAAPIEHIKARLQTQYSPLKSERLYSGPWSCTRSIYATHGIRGLYRGLFATLLFRAWFVAWWGSYDLFSKILVKPKENGGWFGLGVPATSFWAGGLSAQVFWCTSYPWDVVKQRVMTDGLGPATRAGKGIGGKQIRAMTVDRKFPRWKDAAKAVHKEFGWKGFWRGFTPCFLRAFPANAAALVTFEGVMRGLNGTT